MDNASRNTSMIAPPQSACGIILLLLQYPESLVWFYTLEKMLKACQVLSFH